MNLLLRESSVPGLIERRDELLKQVAAINNEVARRYREASAEQARDRAEWRQPRELLAH